MPLLVPKEHKPKFISVIRWVDQSYSHGPYRKEELPFEPIGTTTGFLIAEDKDTIAVSAEWFESDTSFRHVINIPKCAVLSHKKLKVP